MLELIGTVAGVLAIAGVLCNNRKWIACFPLWIVSNALSAAIHYQTGLTALLVRDGVFLVLAVAGWRRWRKGS